MGLNMESPQKANQSIFQVKIKENYSYYRYITIFIATYYDLLLCY
jgi:hypothetical protein